MILKHFIQITTAAIVIVMAFAGLPAKGEDEPSLVSTRDILQLTPESATVSLAFPPIDSLLDKALILAALFSDPGADPTAELNKIIMNWRIPGGLSGQTTLPDILRAYGLDPAAPFGLFLDPSPAALHARKAAELVAAGAVWRQTAPAGSLRKCANNWFSSDFVNAVAVMGYNDPALALNRVENLLMTVLDGKPPAEEVFDGFTIRIHADGIACCAAGKHLFIGNNLPMLRETLERISKPAPVRYGSPECPAKAPGPVVCATRLDRLHALLPDLTGLISRSAAKEQDPFAMNEALHHPITASMGSDPCIATLDVTEKEIEFAAWLNLSAHTQYSALMGKAKPLRLGAFIPEECQAFLCLQLTDTVRDLLRQRWIPFHADDIYDPIGFFRSFHFLNGEAALGIIGGNHSPHVFILAEVSEFDSIKAMIETAARPSPWTEDPKAPGARFADYPPHFFLGRLGNVAIATTDRESCRRLARSLASNPKTPILATHTSPFDPDMPLFGLFSIETDGLDSILPFAAKWIRAESPESFRSIGIHLSRLFRKIQAGKTIQGNWQKVFVSGYLR